MKLWKDLFRSLRGDRTRKQAAALTGYAVGTIRDWEQGLRTPHKMTQAQVIERMRK